MPLPLLALAAATAVPQILKGINGISQLNKAKKVKVQDTTTPFERENMAMLRQDATSQFAPGYGLQRDQLAQGQAGVLSGALRAGGSGSDILSALSRSDAQRQQGMAALNVQNQQFQQQGRRALSAGLMQQAQRRLGDVNNANRERAALTQAGNQNIFSALEGVANTATYFGSKAGQNALNGVTTPFTTPTNKQANRKLPGFDFDKSPLSMMGGYS